MRIENSPEFLAKLEACRIEREHERAECELLYRRALEKWRSLGRQWMLMSECPFFALNDRYGIEGAILVSDETKIALASVRKRFGRPVFYKKHPEQILRDGVLCLIGGEEDPRHDLPEWWWKWELIDEFGDMTYAGGEETGKEEVGFIATIWTFLPELPTRDEK